MSIDISPGQFVTSSDAVVFIHGFMCTADVFDKQYTNTAMLENLYIVRYDIRGCGRSEGPLNEAAYSSERQAEDFKAVIDAYGVTKPFVATWSMGGCVPPDVVAKYGPDSLAGHIMIGSSPHRNMNKYVAYPALLFDMMPGFLTEDAALFAKTLPDFILSFVSPKYQTSL
ncbi:alpha/beta-hydrolase [Gymnopus androsaceus JB14]|uniref:Alpha/beta-hydrolase n=1 Tax=Gymnopus androsaceus JB14 TaxID=1447944 RepID=A0A6A4I960_9AGAR|nr:alpha/beta-hydrolase [Gymnopus androsaceus JB14]